MGGSATVWASSFTMQPSDLARFAADSLFPPSPQLRAAVDWVGDRDPAFRHIEVAVGPLSVRRWPVGLPSLVRIILGQQLSSRAAQAIFQRLVEQLELTPENLVTASASTLQQVGLSHAKVATCQRLAAAMLAGELSLTGLPSLSDADAIAHLTQIKGIGMWTAEIYLLFCLERLSRFPAADLALQVGFQRLKQLETRPTPKDLLILTEPLHPYRGAVAHLLWHYYRHIVRS